MNVNAKLSVVIITLNEEKNIGHILEDLCRQRLPDNMALEVLLVDSASCDRTVEIVESYRARLDLRVIEMSSRGASLGRNTGALNAKYERILFLDADVRIADDFIAKSMRYLNKQGLWVAAGRIGSHDDSFLIRLGIKIFDLGMCMTQFWFPTCTGACIFSTRTVHNHINGFDQAITLCEDCDYVNRAAKTFRFRMLPVFFDFNPRRLKQDGLFKMGWIYLKANVLRFFKGELRNNEIPYPFDHYKKA
ncbi:glycosyltransferase [Pasteurellaceae bacterium LIM206]|nr:glycosyltransferase [Pasteurellaceae bacterium LIM206]